MATKQKYILVTGGAGYIGSHTCKTLAATATRLSATITWYMVMKTLLNGDLLNGVT